jgi:exodeoxyribonuclease V alpha subunit
METLEGTIESISMAYSGGFRIATLRNSQKVVGILPESAEPGCFCIFKGSFRTHPRYGSQFVAEESTVEIPKDIVGQQRYLETFKWIGPILSRKLTNVFGDRIFEIIDQFPERLKEIPGITSERAQTIHEEYKAIKADRVLDVFFTSNGITLNLRNRLVDRYGSKQAAVEAVKENPYRLADEVFGIGFKKADAIALHMGLKKDSRRRASAGISWILGESANGEGHCYLPMRELVERARGILGTSLARITEVVDKGIKDGHLVFIGEDIYRADLYGAEIQVADKLRQLAIARHIPITPDFDGETPELDSDQHQALINALSSKISIITGGPGTGKTYTLNWILRALGHNLDIELAAPTGKAAKRMTEATGRPARTIHRLLAYSPQINQFQRNAESPLECDVLIIDETSMIDIRLMDSLVDALTDKTMLILVGDVDQLPSVGPGRVLSDMIDSGIIPVSRLTYLHRQAAESLININAKRINVGQRLDLSTAKSDFWFVPEEEAEKIPALIINAIQKIPARFGMTPNDIQVLCPQKRSPIGTENLNKVLRPYLNLATVEKKLPGTSFLPGDRVIQTRNNYELEIFNGDIGAVEGVDKEYLYVGFEGIKGKETVSYPLNQLDDLQLAYALTIHKSQGSEFLCVIIPIHTTNYMMLKRNLLYTGITRGKRLVVLIGNMKAVNIATKTLDSSKRYSNLKRFIQEGASR